MESLEFTKFKVLKSLLYWITFSVSYRKICTTFLVYQIQQPFYFNVSSLFTNIPLSECLDFCCNLLFKNFNLITYNNCTFNLDQFKNCLVSLSRTTILCLMENFTTRLMELLWVPLWAPSLANIFMCALEQNFLSNCPSSFKPLLCRRHVDDTFCFYQTNEQVDSLLQYINSFHKNISFTVEKSVENTLRSLDTLVTYENNSFPLVCIEERHSQVFY